MCCVEVVYVKWGIGFFCVVCYYCIGIVIGDDVCGLVDVVYV